MTRRTRNVLFCGLVAAVLCSTASGQAVIQRELTGKVLYPDGTVITSGSLTFQPYGTMPGTAATGILAGASKTYTITNGVLVCSTTCYIAAPANYVFQIKVTESSVTKQTLTFKGSVDDDVSTAITLQEIYRNATSTVTVEEDVIYAGDLLTQLSSGAATSGQVPVADGAGVIAWATLAGDISSVVAGDGLTGGGTSGAVTLAVGAGTGIDVAADTVVLENTAVTPATYGGATKSATITVDQQGRITSASDTTITGTLPGGSAGGDLSGTYPNPTVGADAVALSTDTTGNYVATVAAGTGMSVSGSGSEGAAVTVTLANTAVTAGNYGSSSSIPSITVDAQGRITSASGNSLTITHEMLSATHTDSTASTVSQGSIITGQGGTPKWAELAAGTTGQVLTMGAAEPQWSTVTTAYAQIVSVAKSGGQYTTIQAAINAISDATTSKRYAVYVYPGDYAENVTLKDYVDVLGAGRTTSRITVTTGTALTFPATHSSVFDMGIVATYGALGADTAAIVSGGADSALIRCDVGVSKSGGDFTMNAISVTGGAFRMRESYFTYAITGATVGSVLNQVAIKQDGALTIFLLHNNELVMTSDDTNDDLIGFATITASAGSYLLQNNIITVTATGATAGAYGLWLYGTATGATVARNRVTISGIDNSYGVYIDSTAGGATVNTRQNELIVTSSGTAYSASVDTGDTWDSAGDKITATGGTGGAGTIRLASSLGNGSLTVANGSTAAGSIGFREDADNGSNTATLIGPSSTADVTITLPASTGTVALTSDVIPLANITDGATANVPLVAGGGAGDPSWSGSVLLTEAVGSDSSLGITGLAGVGAGAGGAVAILGGASAGGTGTAGLVSIDAGAAAGGTPAAIAIGAANASQTDFGGGYGVTGATISSAGVGQFNGALTTDGALTADSAVIGGGYGSTGVTLSTAGAISGDASLTVGSASVATSHTLTTYNAATTGTLAANTFSPTYNQASGDAANTDFKLFRTQTAVGSGAQALADLGVGSTSWYKFGVGNTATSGAFNQSAGTAVGARFAPVFATTGTAGYTALEIDATDGAGSGTERLLDLQVGNTTLGYFNANGSWQLQESDGNGLVYSSSTNKVSGGSATIIENYYYATLSGSYPLYLHHATSTKNSGTGYAVIADPTLNQSSTAGYRAFNVFPVLTALGSGANYFTVMGVGAAGSETDWYTFGFGNTTTTGIFNGNSGTAVGAWFGPNFSGITGTGGYTGLEVDVTDGGGSGAELIADFQLGSASKFSVSGAGAITATGAAALNGGITVDGTAFTVADTSGDTVTLGTLNLGADNDTSTLTIHDAGTIVMYDDGDDTSVTLGPVADGTTTLGVTGGLDVSGATDFDGSVNLGDASGDSIVAKGTVTTTNNVGTAGAGTTAAEYGTGAFHRTVLTLGVTGDNKITLADGAHGDGRALYTFPEGAVILLGWSVDGTVTNTTNFNADTNDTFSFGIGLAEANDDGDLSDTDEQSLHTNGSGGSVNIQTDTGGGAGSITTRDSHLLISPSVWFEDPWRLFLNGTSAAKTIYANFAIIDANNTGSNDFTFTGTMTLAWVHIGDY